MLTEFLLTGNLKKFISAGTPIPVFDKLKNKLLPKTLSLDEYIFLENYIVLQTNENSRRVQDEREMRVWKFANSKLSTFVIVRSALLLFSIVPLSPSAESDA